MAYSQVAGTNVNAANAPYRTDMATATSGSNTTGGKLWIPIWSGEVIHAYDQYNKFEGMVDSRTISSGTTLEFPITGTVSLKPAWEAGEELIGGENAAATTFQIKLDKRPMASHFELDNIDLMVTQWEYRTELARQAGLTLANARDKQIAAYIARAAAEELPSGDPRGLTLKEPFSSTTLYQYLGSADSTKKEERTNAALQLLADCENWMVYLQTNDISTEGVYCAVTPQAFADIRALGVARPNDTLGSYPAPWSESRPLFGGVAEVGGLGGSIAARPHLEETLEYMGVTICKTNHGPFSDYYTTNIGEARYNLDFTGGMGAQGGVLPDDDSAATVYDGACKAVMWQRGAVASLGLQGLKVDTVDDIRRNTTFTVASMMKGTGVLRPECAVALIDTSAAAGTAATTRAHMRSAWAMVAEHIQA
jgi:hypothetical protein